MTAQPTATNAAPTGLTGRKLQTCPDVSGSNIAAYLKPLQEEINFGGPLPTLIRSALSEVVSVTEAGSMIAMSPELLLCAPLFDIPIRGSALAKVLSRALAPQHRPTGLGMDKEAA
jgi:hypothetical protein